MILPMWDQTSYFDGLVGFDSIFETPDQRERERDIKLPNTHIKVVMSTILAILSKYTQSTSVSPLHHYILFHQIYQTSVSVQSLEFLLH